MKNQANEWIFVTRPSRAPLTVEEAHYWGDTLHRLLKSGIEIELNLPDKNGTCDRQNYLCQCKNPFVASSPMPDTKMCYEQCRKWDKGNCEIAKSEGCVGVYCVAFESPCPKCQKYDRGCDGCPELYSPLKDPRYVREIIGAKLQPTKFVGQVGANGIYKVCRDGSLLGDGGVEVATVGRRVQFAPIYEMIKTILDETTKYGAYANERCSIHMHLLASYLTKGFDNNDRGKEYILNEITELERPVPEIIVANFHQLIRRYQSALVWMTAAGEHRDHLTRWEKFRKSILPYSAVRNKMAVVAGEAGTASKSKPKYALMNYEQMQFNALGDVERLHVEARYMDGCLSPAAIAAHNCLLYGIMLKAVELSRHGVLESGNQQYMKLQNEIFNHLCNGDGDWNGSRHSDTSRLEPYIPELQRQSMQLIRLVKNTLSEMTPADDILRSLAEKPIALRRIEGKSWQQIEEELMPSSRNRDRLEDSIFRLVSLGAISECHTVDEWLGAAADQIASEENVGSDENKVSDLRTSIKAYVDELALRRRIHWSESVGGFLAG